MLRLDGGRAGFEVGDELFEGGEGLLFDIAFSLTTWADASPANLAARSLPYPTTAARRAEALRPNFPQSFEPFFSKVRAFYPESRAFSHTSEQISRTPDLNNSTL